MIQTGGHSLDKIDRKSELYKFLVSANSRLSKKDPNIWGEEAAKEAAIRLNWVDLPTSSLSLIDQLQKLQTKFEDKSRLILCGMGGSSLAPEVLAASFKKEIFVLDSTDPNYIAHALADDLTKTIVLVSSKSGSTIETTSQRAYFEGVFKDAKLNPTDHIIFCTDPGSPLDIDVRSLGYTVVNADPNVGGRFSALSAFGLTPAALLGISVSELLANAKDTRGQLNEEFNPAIDVAYLLATQSNQYLAFADSPSMPGLSDWIEQLIAESTGKNGVGRVPVVIEAIDAPIASNQFRIGFESEGDLQVNGDLSSQFLFWEWATALLGAALKIDPFNQPNVTEAKEQTGRLIAEWGGELPKFTPSAIDGEIEIFGKKESVKAELNRLISEIPEDGYLAITAYLDRRDDEKLSKLRRILADKSGRPVTFGWGPRFLHSTGQFHKGGQPNGVFLQITGAVIRDYQIPGAKYGFSLLIMAQALGDGRALEKRNYPISRFHLKNREIGIDQLLTAAKEL